MLKIETYQQQIDNELWLAERNSNETPRKQSMRNKTQERVSWLREMTM